MNKMKKVVLILLLLLNTASAICQEQSLFTDKIYTKSLGLAKSENKPLVLFFYASWCPHCGVMKREVFTDATVVDFYSKNFVCMAVDVESEYGKELKTKFQNKFRVNSFPTFAFLDANETLLYCTSGELKKDKFLSEGNEVLLPVNQLPNMKNDFLADSSNSDKCMKYVSNLRKAGLDPTPIAQKYWSTLNEEQKLTEQNWRIFANGIQNFDTDEFRFVIQNKETYSKIISAKRVEKKFVYTISETLKPFVEKADTLNYNKKRFIAESFQIRKIDSLLYRLDIQLAIQTNNWKKYQRITTNNVEKFSWNDPAFLYDVCDTYFHNISDKKGLLLAINWGKHVLDFGESIDKYVLLTNISLKLNDYKMAKDFATKGKAFADVLKLNSDALNPLLEEAKKHNK
jgi:thioredoxin-related protein